MAQIEAAWSEEAQKALGAGWPGAMEALARHPTVREILKIHGVETRIWVQAAKREAGSWTASGSYQTPDGDSVHFKIRVSEPS